MIKSMQYYRRFWVLTAVILAHGVIFVVLRNGLGLSQQEVPAVSREIMVSFISAAPEKISVPMPQSIPQSAPKAQTVAKSSSVLTIAPSVMPLRSVAATASEVASPAPVAVPVQPPAASSTIAPASPAQPKTISSGIEYLQKSQPEYPLFSRRRREEGTVTLRVLVNIKGKPEQVEVQKSSGFPRLDEAARQAVVSSYVFKPHSENGQPVVMSAVVPIVFQLEN